MAKPSPRKGSTTRASTAPSSAVETPVQRPHRLWCSFLAVAIVAWIGVVNAWLISAGRMSAWPQYGPPFYSLLADAFVLGQTHLAFPPRPEILALPDPYDPQANEAFRMHDAALYHGKYYIYWGPAPAAVLAVYKIVAMADASDTVGDQYIVYWAVMAAVALGAAAIVRLKSRLYPHLPWWSVGPPILALGGIAPVPFAMGRAAVYEAAIFAGQAGLIGALYMAIAAMTTDRPRRRSAWLLGSGLCAGFALLSRSSLLFGIAALAGCVIYLLWRGRQPGMTRGSAVLASAAILLPIAAAGMLQAAYNWVRFGSITEFGVRYQLAAMNSLQVADHLFSVLYVPANLWRYLFALPQFRAEFPYVFAGIDPWVIGAFRLPADFIVESAVGMAWAAPFLWFAAVLPLRLNKNEAEAGTVQPTSRTAFDLSRWTVVLLASVAVLGFAPALFVLASTMRYLADGAAAAVLLAALGFWNALLWSEGKAGWRRAVVGFAMASTAFMFGLGVLLGISGYYGHFQTRNPELMSHLNGRVEPPNLSNRP